MEVLGVKEYENIFKAFADKNRLRILKLLEYKDFCVCEIAFIIGIKQSSISRHLNKLKKAGLITSFQESFWTNYTLNKHGNAAVKILLGNLSVWMNDDEIIQKDKEKSQKADRSKICKA
ncbi:MAG: metalloregulator ArsR/SmtB family transcription factor [Elusimicrobia bacterium]|nr:metalloregulator ArsR/SmtB family transcription factor [Elusimicrobiota bacterium]